MFPDGTSDSAIKSCCVDLYQSEWARILLGESLHPGGLLLTERLGQLLALGPGVRVLDVAAGNGASAAYLVERFGCHVTGVDLGAKNVRAGARKAAEPNLGELLQFAQADGERLPFQDGTFDALICECSYCTFPNKVSAAREFARVLRPGGALGVTDMTIAGPIPESLRSLLAWAACIADAQRADDYVQQFKDAGFTVTAVEDHQRLLRSLVQKVRTKLLGLEVLTRLGKLSWSEGMLQEAKALAHSAATAIENGLLSYDLFTGVKQKQRPGQSE